VADARGDAELILASKRMRFFLLQEYECKTEAELEETFFDLIEEHTPINDVPRLFFRSGSEYMRGYMIENIHDNNYACVTTAFATAYDFYQMANEKQKIMLLSSTGLYLHLAEEKDQPLVEKILSEMPLHELAIAHRHVSKNIFSKVNFYETDLRTVKTLMTLHKVLRVRFGKEEKEELGQQRQQRMIT
jgi:hypothetical protein